MAKKKSWFSRAAKGAASFTGRPLAFMMAAGTVVLWLVTGPVFKYSDTWQLVINTGTTIVTFLMVFLIQNSQNRDTAAIHIKLDELLRSTKGAHNSLLNLEELEEDELEAFRKTYCELAQKARELADSEGQDAVTESGSPEVDLSNATAKAGE
jgi:low affinity Fe/Cu permease